VALVPALSLACPVAAAGHIYAKKSSTFEASGPGLAPPKFHHHHAHRPPSRLCRRQRPLPCQCHREGWLYGRMGKVARRCARRRGTVTPPRPCTHHSTRADPVARLETHHPGRRPLWTLPLAARQGGLHCTHSGAHQGGEAVYGNMCGHAGVVPELR
jgi:hypothetical protein